MSKTQKTVAHPEGEKQSIFKQAGVWVFCVAGIYACFMFNSYMKEIILTGKENKSKLVGESVMLLVQSALIFVVGIALYFVRAPKGESLNLTNKYVM